MDNFESPIVPSSKILPLRHSESSEPEKFSGPVSAAMWKKVKSLDSKYPDTFDYSVYDRLFFKFGDKQPRGGVVYKTGMKLANWHPSCSKCHYSLELDTYGRGCTFNCRYCYAKEQLTRHGYWNEPHPMPADISEIRKVFSTVFETSKRSPWRSILQDRIPLRIGSMSDSFMWLDQKFRVTHELLKILSFYEYPYIIFTRSDLVAEEDYLSVLRPDLCSVQISLSGDNENITRKLEPGAPSVQRRLDALARLSEHGIWTAVRLNPLFPTYPDGYFSSPNSTAKRFPQGVPKFDLLNIDNCGSLLDRLQAAGVATVLSGFVRLSSFSIESIKQSCGVDLGPFFDPANGNDRNDRRFSDAEISFYYRKLHDESRKRGLRFTTCYIGNGIKDYFQYQKTWSNKSDCCDVRGNVPSFKKSCQSIDWATRFQHSKSEPATKQAQFDEASWAEPSKASDNRRPLHLTVVSHGDQSAGAPRHEV